MAEFTGERVIPGQVDADLWNEHWARYLFASRLSRNKRVLDLACGTGYGVTTMAQHASRILGVDQSFDAVSHARSHYAAPNTHFLQASVTNLPLSNTSFDLITAFEVIEHLDQWRSLLSEAQRLLAPGGQFIVSTPNKAYYAESRKLAGPNPYHAHEFLFDEFRAAILEFFPHASFFSQNHASGIAFQPLQPTTSTELRLESTTPDPATSNFFLAVCALSHQTGGPAFIYIPTTANVLREREQHIARLEQELVTKNAWLEKAQSDHATLVQLHKNQKRELEARNLWAERLNKELDQTLQRVVELQNELSAEQQQARETVAAYEEKVRELDNENLLKTQWAQETERTLTAEIAAKSNELAACVANLHETENSLEERTRWAQSLSKEREKLQAKLSMVQASRWYRMGRAFGLGPEVQNR